MGRRWRSEFDWSGGNEEKILQRDISAADVEECFANQNTRRRNGKDYLLLGKTDGDRMLVVVYEQRPGGVVRPYSARDMTEGEKAAFRKYAR